MTPVAAFTSSFTPTGLRPHIADRALCAPKAARVFRQGASSVRASFFMPPQPGDAGYKPGGGSKPEKKEKSESPSPQSSFSFTPKPKPKAPEPTEEPKKKQSFLSSLNRTADFAETAKRGFELLKEDLLRSAPERVGVGRQDETTVVAPMAGEPGYKPRAFETVRVSESGISPFSDDANSVSKVGGLKAVRKAARDFKTGKTAAEIRAEAIKNTGKPIYADDDDEEEKISRPTIKPPVSKIKTETINPADLPAYLKPLPEDTPRNGYSWKNYSGR